jgi:hypothetical protein
MLVAVEKLPAWCLGGDYALLGRCKELSQQVLNEPFDEVKAQMVCFCIVYGRFTDLLARRQRVLLPSH